MKLHDFAAEDVRKKTLKDKEEADRQAQLKLQHEQDLKDKESPCTAMRATTTF